MSAVLQVMTLMAVSWSQMILILRKKEEAKQRDTAVSDQSCELVGAGAANRGRDGRRETEPGCT